MPKNKYLIEQMKKLHNVTRNVTPEVYAGIALTLHRKYGWGYKRINALFKESQDLWEECVNRGVNMREICLEETGIDLRAK